MFSTLVEQVGYMRLWVYELMSISFNSFSLLLMYSFTPAAPLIFDLPHEMAAFPATPKVTPAASSLSHGVNYELWTMNYRLFRLRRPLREFHILYENNRFASQFPIFTEIVLYLSLVICGSWLVIRELCTRALVAWILKCIEQFCYTQLFWIHIILLVCWLTP